MIYAVFHYFEYEDWYPVHEFIIFFLNQSEAEKYMEVKNGKKDNWNFFYVKPIRDGEEIETFGRTTYEKTIQ